MVSQLAASAHRTEGCRSVHADMYPLFAFRTSTQACITAILRIQGFRIEGNPWMPNPQSAIRDLTSHISHHFDLLDHHRRFGFLPAVYGAYVVSPHPQTVQ